MHFIICTAGRLPTEKNTQIKNMMLEQEKRIFSPISHIQVIQKLDIFKMKFSVLFVIIFIVGYLGNM